MSVFFLHDKTMKAVFFYVMLFVPFLISAQNTEYETEQIIWEGKTYPYRYHHLEQYFNYHPEKRPVVNTDSTIINRNYIAIFEIKESTLYLNDLLVSLKHSEDKNQSVLEELNQKKGPLPLHWVTGLFEFGIGPEKFHKHDSTLVYYDDYIVFEVNRGKIGRIENFSYNEMKLFKDYQHRRFVQKNDYKRLLERLKKNGMSEVEASSHVYHYILFYSRSNFLRKTH